METDFRILNNSENIWMDSWKKIGAIVLKILRQIYGLKASKAAG